MSNLRAELHAFVDKIADAIEKSGAANDYVSQKTSPLGRDKHLRLAREGAFPSVREGRLVLVRRTDLEAYLAKHKVTPKIDPLADEEREAERIAASIGARRR